MFDIKSHHKGDGRERELFEVILIARSVRSERGTEAGKAMSQTDQV